MKSPWASVSLTFAAATRPVTSIDKIDKSYPSGAGLDATQSYNAAIGAASISSPRYPLNVATDETLSLEFQHRRFSFHRHNSLLLPGSASLRMSYRFVASYLYLAPADCTLSSIPVIRGSPPRLLSGSSSAAPSISPFKNTISPFLSSKAFSSHSIAFSLSPSRQ